MKKGTATEITAKGEIGARAFLLTLESVRTGEAKKFYLAEDLK